MRAIHSLLIVSSLLGLGCASQGGVVGASYDTVETYVASRDSSRLAALANQLQEEFLALDPDELVAAAKAEFAQRDPWAEGGPVSWEGFRLEVSQTPLAYSRDLLGSGRASGPPEWFGVQARQLPDGATGLATLRFGISHRPDDAGFPSYPSFLPLQLSLTFQGTTSSVHRQTTVIHSVVLEKVARRIREKLSEEDLAAQMHIGGRQQ